MKLGREVEESNEEECVLNQEVEESHKENRLAMEMIYFSKFEKEQRLRKTLLRGK